ncbi:MAG: zf-HC2 domain-containing protein [Phycisphaerae bacterium]|nr:zf-HC2 domain-containing protein [Phycisphaerae bacterium]
MTNHHDITCRELAEFIADYLDHTLPADIAREFDRHLAVCPSCVAYIESYKQTIRLGKAAFAQAEAPADASAPQAILNAVRAARKSAR